MDDPDVRPAAELRQARRRHASRLERRSCPDAELAVGQSEQGVRVKVFELVIAALRELAGDASASITPAVGLAGPVPTFEVGFDLSISANLSRRLFDGMAARAGDQPGAAA
jgi:hypothetical protein